MSISKDDLLADPLLPSLIEEAKPALTLSELFNTERVVLGAVKSQVDTAFDWLNKYQEAVSPSVAEAVPTTIRKYSDAPKFEFDDPSKNTLANNAWNQLEYRLASGGSMIPRETVEQNIRFMLRLNMTIYDSLPHKNFIGVQPMDHQCQLVYHNEFSTIQHGVEKLEMVETNNSVKTYNIEAKSRKLKTSVTDEAMLDMRSINQLDLEDELVKAAAHAISGEMYSEMVSKIASEANTSTVTAAKDTAPSALDIMASIHEASNEIRKKSAVGNQANWIIMSPQMAAILLSTEQELDTSHRKETPHVSLIGNLHGMDVFMDTAGAIKANDILVGRKGSHAFSQGMTYCPHTLAMDSGDVVNPMTFNTVKTFITRGDYFMPDDAKQYFHKIEFKEAPVGYKGQSEMDAGYFYCPYIPLMTTDVIDKDENLMDIILPFGAPEKKTIAELFSKRIET